MLVFHALSLALCTEQYRLYQRRHHHDSWLLIEHQAPLLLLYCLGGRQSHQMSTFDGDSCNRKVVVVAFSLFCFAQFSFRWLTN